MSPGSISKLASEYDPAFRVRFEGDPPPRAALYFRGPVLNDFDGFTWRRARSKYYTGPQLVMLGEPVRYRVTLEPTNQPWLFALDTLAQIPQRDMFMAPHDRQLSASAPVTSHAELRRGLSSDDSHRHCALGARAGVTKPRCPRPQSARTRAGAAIARAERKRCGFCCARVLDWFRDNGLEYSLEPGVTSIDSVDTTLFDSKLGFCGHFASSYAMMMRAAGVPARVVTGYLGGEWNPVGGYLIVRQSDAHAWTEVWLEGSGWTRIDPTAVVAPERLERGIFDLAARLHCRPPAVSCTTTVSWFAPRTLMGRRQPLVAGTRGRVQRTLPALICCENSVSNRRTGAISVGHSPSGCCAWIAWVSLTLRRGVARVKPDRIGRAWLRATRKLARVAPARAAAEGPMAYARRVGEHRPDLAARIAALASLYASLRFGRDASHQDIAAFEREVRNLAV